MSSSRETIPQLEELMARTVNAREAYKNASKNVHNKPLTVFFEEAAHTHERFSEKLKKKIYEEGGKSEEKSDFKSQADRFWLDFASIIVRRNESAILKACARAEEQALQQYDEVLSKELSEQIKQDIEEQRRYAAGLLNEVQSMMKKYSSD